MATPVLPYPDMDFTPLDILTAAEMDQMVANDQYLRDFCAGLADGTNLSDGVIQARKLTPGIGNYSTTEVDTGFTWVNSKHIYKKTLIYSGGITANSEKEISHGITNFDRCIRVEATGFGDNGTSLMIPAIHNNGSEIGIWTITNTVIKLQSKAILYTASIYITLYYTKTA